MVKKIIGIYEIHNIANNKRYIGKSVDVTKRLKQHKNKLKKNIHSNVYLQRAWNVYSEQNFIF